MPPAVSVIMPVYNGERFLRTAVDSVLAQTFGDWELIVIDDASTDSTPEILAAYRDPRIQVLHNERNKHTAASLNRGIAAACGRYIANLDADDVFLPGRLAEQVRHLETHPGVVLVASAAHLIDEHGARVGLHPGGLNDCELKFTFVSRNPVIHSTVLFRAEAAGQLHGYSEDPGYSTVSDYEFWSRFAFRGKAHVLPQPLAEYRIHPSSMSAVHHNNQELQSESITRAFVVRALRREVDDRWWQAWRRFNWTKAGETVYFESDEAKLLSELILCLLRCFPHDRDGGCVLPWRWARHALALAIGRRGPISLATRARFLTLAVKIATRKLICH